MSAEIVCPNCQSTFTRLATSWKCDQCGYDVKLVNGIPAFSEYPEDLNPSDKIERSAEQGSVWRRFNWKFLEETANSLPTSSEVLDIGAGRGDFKTIFANHSYTGLDIYPYPELDLAVDLIKTCPFKEGMFDLVVLANVIEHVYEYRALVKRAASMLKPGGRILITVPFLLKLHQEPVDYHRHTRYALAQFAFEAGLTVERLDGYYNPAALLDEGIGNVWQFGVPKTRGFNKILLKSALMISQNISNFTKRLIGNGYVSSSETEDNPNVLGYQCLFLKPMEGITPK